MSKPSDQNPATEALLAIALEWAPRFVQALLTDLPSIRDLRIRALALGERLQPLNADDILAVAHHLNEAALQGNEAAVEVLLCFRDSQAMEERLGAAKLQVLAARARQMGHTLPAALLQIAHAPTGGGTRTHRDLRDLTLGQRKALAKGHRKDLLLKLLEDDHPHVLENLLNNPRITTREVISIVVKRPALPHVLRRIARHPRWMHHLDVLRALVRNPDAPLDVTASITAILPRTDLEEIVADARLDARLRELAALRLKRLAMG